MELTETWLRVKFSFVSFAALERAKRRLRLVSRLLVAKKLKMAMGYRRSVLLGPMC
jgi:hypothetical protein